MSQDLLGPSHLEHGHAPVLPSSAKKAEAVTVPGIWELDHVTQAEFLHRAVTAIARWLFLFEGFYCSQRTFHLKRRVKGDKLVEIAAERNYLMEENFMFLFKCSQ